MLQTNILFDNRYKLIKLLGRGGFSEVWLAKDNWTHLQIAIKVYAPGQGMDLDGLQDFCGELANVYDLNHSNLLKPQHVDSWENMPYLIMPYCPAGSCIKRVGKMPEQELWKLIHDVAAGLAYLHEKDVIHQDIKPDNVLVDTDGNYLITDFGISTRARSTLRKSVIGGNISGGTTAYMGPERFSRQPAPTKASDIWSFGAMAFELLEGIPPFGELGGGMQKGGAEIPFINAQVSDALKYTIFKMLSKETWDRPTAATLVEWANDPNTIDVDYDLLTEEIVVAPQTPSPIPVKNDSSQSQGRDTQRINQVTSSSSSKKTSTKVSNKSSNSVVIKKVVPQSVQNSVTTNTTSTNSIDYLAKKIYDTFTSEGYNVKIQQRDTILSAIKGEEGKYVRISKGSFLAALLGFRNEVVVEIFINTDGKISVAVGCNYNVWPFLLSFAEGLTTIVMTTVTDDIGLGWALLIIFIMSGLLQAHIRTISKNIGIIKKARSVLRNK